MSKDVKAGLAALAIICGGIFSIGMTFVLILLVARLLGLG